MEKRIDLEKRGRPASQITELNLDNCRSTNIVGLNEEFVNLKQLSLINVGLTSLKGFPKLPNLKKLELSDNRISNGLNFLEVSPNITHLNLSGNRLNDLDALKPLENFKHLEVLDLFNNEVTVKENYREKTFQMLPSLKYLDGFDSKDMEAPSDADDDEEVNGYANAENYEGKTFILPVVILGIRIRLRKKVNDSVSGVDENKRIQVETENFETPQREQTEPCPGGYLMRLSIDPAIEEILRPILYVPSVFSTILDLVGKIVTPSGLFHMGIPNLAQPSALARSLLIFPVTMRQLMELMSNPASDVDERRDFIEYNSIPGASFSDQFLLENSDDIWPVNAATATFVSNEVHAYKN
uniref:U2A'/phosphoprotein 32 family A C-terminal domain-containing protein n=1 Tax=Phlebotomus papatasi TaxID=29031 RepID=A0A1B0DGY5_PHLPP